MYRHAIERQLSVNLKLVGWSHPSTCIHQGITKLGERKHKES